MNGVLIIDMEPASIVFYRDGAKDGQRRNCTQEEIRQLLLDLDGLSPFQHWPLKDCQILLHGKYSAAQLAPYLGKAV
ncbi:MAG TPA: hypothetical protein V6D22_13150 [Candidatus Obscuribacterales bacterium]